MTTATAPGCRPILVDERQGTLTLNGVAMCTAWWCVANVSQLWQDADQRGTDRVIPGVAGVLSYPRRATETTFTLDIVITGAILYTNTPVTNPALQFGCLGQNVDRLTSTVTVPINTGTGTIPGVLTMPDTTTRSAQVHVGPLRIQELGGPLLVAKFDLTIPAGRFT